MRPRGLEPEPGREEELEEVAALAVAQPRAGVAAGRGVRGAARDGADGEPRPEAVAGGGGGGVGGQGLAGRRLAFGGMATLRVGELPAELHFRVGGVAEGAAVKLPALRGPPMLIHSKGLAALGRVHALLCRALWQRRCHGRGARA